MPMNQTALQHVDTTPVKRLYTRKEAMSFLGMNVNEWYRDAKPYLTQIKRGTQKSVYCFYELNALADKIKAASGRPAKKELEQWDNENQAASIKGAKPGILTKSYKDEDFTEALTAATSRRR